MSVWSVPCYSIEPLRYATNNLPSGCVHEFPEELSGIANFRFGDCDIRHKEKAGKNAASYFRDNPKEWGEFFRGGINRAYGAKAITFRNTLIQTNTKYSGIRAVYWAFEKFRSDAWSTKETFPTEEAIEFTSKAFEISGPASRINPQTSINASTYYKEGIEATTSWLSRESKADSVRFLWSLKTSRKNFKLSKKTKTLVERIVSTKIRKVKMSKDVDTIIPNVPARIFGDGKFDVDNHRKAFDKIRNEIKQNRPISTSDAKAINILPYVEYPSRGGALLVFMFPDGLILYDKHDRKSAIFLQKDFDRLVQMLQSDAKLTMYYSKYTFTDRALSDVMIGKYEDIMKSFLCGVDYESAEKCNLVCRAYDVYQFLFLARLGSDVSTRALDDQMKKIRDEKLDEVVSATEFMAIIDDLDIGVKESLELAKFNKIFPCPDYCIYSVVDGIEKKARSTHPVSDTVSLGVVDGVSVVASRAEFKDYMKRNRIINYYDVHKFLPGTIINDDDADFPVELLQYPSMPLEKIKLEHMKYICITGTFQYRKFNGCEDEIIKDKVIAPTTFSGDDKKIMDFSKIERNQVLKFLFSSLFKSQIEVTELAVSGDLFKVYKAWIQLASKAEAKKPGSRVFMMGTDEQRRYLSEAEANVTTYVSKQRGSSVGKSTIELEKRLSALAATPTYLDGLLDVILSFDLAGFSPQQNPRFKEDAIEVWADAFGVPEFEGIGRIFTENILVFQKFDVADEYKTRGNDLEGFQGKLNTATHLDVMGYSVYKLRQLRLTKGTANLEVFIDDGLLRIKTGDKDEDVEAVIDVIDKIYQFSGQKISWDKTFYSRLLCQYLNKVYYDGIEVTPGAKAFMRIGKKQETAVPTLSDEIMAHAASARGAIQSGTDHFLAHYTYIFETYKTMKRWGLKELDSDMMDRLAFTSFVPIGLGGFGLSTLYGISTNESFNAMQSGIASMKSICHSRPGYARLANFYLNAGVRDMDAEAILRNPTSMRTRLRCLNLRRFANAAKSKILSTSTNELIIAANRGVFDKIDDTAIAAIDSESNLSEIKRKLLFEMTFLNYIDRIVGKLQSSDTAAALLGRRRCIAIYIANRSEARMLLNDSANGKYVVRDAS